mmetsp:Transcript_65058/g.209627  ORF Transcript_65058/g.209627 Transcript_65058/m.209627 type:complete len:293 (+) Transcript_65058:397-1275(+)
MLLAASVPRTSWDGNAPIGAVTAHQLRNLSGTQQLASVGRCSGLGIASHSVPGPLHLRIEVQGPGACDGHSSFLHVGAQGRQELRGLLTLWRVREPDQQLPGVMMEAPEERGPAPGAEEVAQGRRQALERLRRQATGSGLQASFCRCRVQPEREAEALPAARQHTMDHGRVEDHQPAVQGLDADRPLWERIDKQLPSVTRCPALIKVEQGSDPQAVVVLPEDVTVCMQAVAPTATTVDLQAKLLQCEARDQLPHQRKKALILADGLEGRSSTGRVVAAVQKVTLHNGLVDDR